MNVFKFTRAVLLSATVAVSVAGAVSVCAAPPSDDYTLAFSDEFDGTALNEDIWQYRIEEKLGGMSRKENVHIKDGRLVIDFKKETVNGKEIYTCGGVITKDFFGYGYYETKSKLFNKTGGMHSAFWTFGLNGDGVNTPKYNQVLEIDGYEIDSHKPNEAYYSIVYYIGQDVTGVSSGRKDMGFDSAEKEFVVGFEWLPDRVVWYLDGQKVHEDFGVGYYAPQNVWLTALANTHTEMSGAIDDSKFNGEVSWDYFRYYTRELKGANLLGGGDFEFNINKNFKQDRQIDAQFPVSWIETGDAQAQYIVESDEAYTGDCLLHQQSDSAYKVGIKQNLTYIQNGKYNLSVMLRSSGGQNEIKLKAYGFDGDQVAEKSFHTDATGKKWQKLSIEGIEIKDGKCTVEFYSDANGGQWLDIDAVRLELSEGGGGDMKEFVRGFEENLPAGDAYSVLIKADNKDPQFSTSPTLKTDFKDGESLSEAANKYWVWSGLPGSVSEKSIYTFDPAGYAQWSPKIENGMYKIYWYAVCHPNSTDAAKLEIVHADGTETKTVSLQKEQSESGWIDLGTYKADTTKPFYVKLTQGGKGTLRCDAIKLIHDSVDNLRKSLVLAVDKHYAYVNDVKMKIDPANPAVAPVLVNSRTLVPLRFITESLGATVDWDEATQTVGIRLDGKSIQFVIDSPEFTIDGVGKALDTPAQLINERTFVPLRALGEAVGKNVYWSEQSQSIIISDKAIVISPEIETYLSGVFGSEK